VAITDILGRARSKAKPGSYTFWWVLSAVFALGFGHGVLVHPHHLGIGDWDYFTSHSLVAYKSWFEFGEAPFWSPYHCGGQAIPENFQSRAWAPSFLLVALLGVDWGNRIWMLVCLAVGFEGGRRWAMGLGASLWGSLFAAFAIAGNGAILSRIGVGHFSAMPYLFLPWWLLAMRSAADRPIHGALVGGLWGALCYLEGGIQPLVYGALIAAAWMTARAVAQRSWRPGFGLAVVVLATPLLCAHIAWPSVENLVQNARSNVAREAVSLAALPGIFLSTDMNWRGPVRFPGQHWLWYEYATYVGPIFFVGWFLALLRGNRAVLAWSGLGVLFALYGLGDVHRAAPWSLGHELPLLRIMRVSGRAFIPAVMCWSLAAGLALDRWRFAPLITCGLALNLVLVSPTALRNAFHIPIEAHPEAEFAQRMDTRHFRLLATRNYSLMTLDVASNRGALSCYEPLRPARGAKARWPERGEVWLSGTRGRARISRWSPNALTLALHDIDSPGHLLVNQNHHFGWRARDGRPVTAREGVLSLPVGPDDAELHLRFHPPRFYEGLVLSLLVLAALLVARRRCERPRFPAGAAQTPAAP
jgi:hypothetical protein